VNVKKERSQSMKKASSHSSRRRQKRFHLKSAEAEGRGGSRQRVEAALKM
jgi:hypothetical protein